MSTVEAQTTNIPVGTYAADPSHSSAEFAVSHMNISTEVGSKPCRSVSQGVA